jgi:hypothetical protein
MGSNLSDLYSKRHGKYIKKAADEDFITSMNKTLQEREIDLYQDHDIEYPFLFVFGLPRSGTTLITQVIAHSCDIGFINNLMARFWLAPLHGVRLSKLLFGAKRYTEYKSDYAATFELTDIHEFGYFWRHWLKKESFWGITNAKEIEHEIDWQGLKKILANLQHEFNKPMIFKNIFGSYHLARLKELLEKVIYIYIKRDPLDIAVSILAARKKYYSDLNTWWSYMPVEYDKIKDLDYWQQIAGQVYYLKRYYDKEISSSNLNNVVQVEYGDLAANPQTVLEMIKEKSEQLYGYSIQIINKPPLSFPFRIHSDKNDQREEIKILLEEFASREK